MEGSHRSQEFAANAAAIAAEAADATLLQDKFQLILDAGWQVFKALRYLLIDVLGEVALWAAAHPTVKWAFYATIIIAVGYEAARWWLNFSWQRGLKDDRTPRLVSKSNSKWALRLDEVDDADASSEDDAENFDGGTFAATPSDRERRSSHSVVAAAARQTPSPDQRSIKELLSRDLPLGPGADSSAAGLSPKSGNVRSASKGALLRQCRTIADGLDAECLQFLEDRLQLESYGPDEVVFERGAARDAFLIIQSGQVLVEARPPVMEPSSGGGLSTPSCYAGLADPRGGVAHRDEYALGAGDTIVGFLFLLASLDAGANAPPPPDTCRFHNSTARAGTQGAEVVALPTEAIAAFFEKWPERLYPTVQRLCVRLGFVVLDALSTYFGLRHEVINRSASYAALDPTDLPELASAPPSDLFARVLGCPSWSERRTEADADSDKCNAAEILASATTLEVEADQYAIAPQQRSNHLLVLLEGDLRMEVRPTPRSGAQQARKTDAPTNGEQMLKVPRGHAIGELAILVEGVPPLVYRCATRCRFAALPRDAMLKLFQLQPRLYCLRLLHLVAARCAPWLHRVDAALDWLPVEGGRCLFRKGDRMVGFFVVLSGRLLALEKDDDGPRSKGRRPGFAGGSKLGASSGSARFDHSGRWRVADVYQRGRLCGELDCLRDLPYSGTVHASRDTEVCRIAPSLLHLIASEFPKAILHFSALVGPQGDHDAGPRERDKVTITVVPASADVKIHDVCGSLTSALSKLGKTLHVSPDSDLTSGIGSARHLARRAARPRPGVAADLRSLDGPRLARVLADLEERHRWVVYEAEHGWTDWTQRCVRQADHILIAANFDGSSRGDVPPTTMERHIEEAVPLYVERDLLLLHAAPAGESSAQAWQRQSTADLMRPGLRGFVSHHTQLLFSQTGSAAKRSTRHYLNRRPWARRWHHVRPHELADWNRCARLLAGCAVGLCLGGGGARGNAHFGLIRAMHELGIPIDVVSGTSFGALAGAIYCMSASQPGSLQRMVSRIMGKYFNVRHMLLDINFPRTSYFTGHYLNRVLQNAFARRRCEDLLVPFACTTCDIANFEAKIHTCGPLWRIVRASMSLVGFVPPLPFEERRAEDGKIVNSLLVDGGYVNQYPIEVLKEHGAGLVICSVVCADYESVAMDFGDTVRGGIVTMKRMFGCCRRAATLDPPSQAEIQERLMFLVESMKESHTSRSDLTFKAPIEAYGLLDFAKYKEITEVGYDAAVPRLREWLAEGGKAAQQMLEVIEINKADEEKSHSINQVEYGGRRTYALWRRVRARAIEAGRLPRRLRLLRKQPRNDLIASDHEGFADSGGEHSIEQSEIFKRACSDGSAEST